MRLLLNIQTELTIAENAIHETNIAVEPATWGNRLI